MLQDWLPVAKLTAFGAPGLRGSVVVLKAYLDGSGSSDDPASRFLTLAVIMGRDQDWTTMEGQWGAALGALARFNNGFPMLFLGDLGAKDQAQLRQGYIHTRSRE